MRDAPLPLWLPVALAVIFLPFCGAATLSLSAHLVLCPPRYICSTFYFYATVLPLPPVPHSPAPASAPPST